MNMKALIAVVFASFFIVQAAGAIEIGLIQDYAGVHSSYAYNASKTVLCSPTSECDYTGYYYCPTLEVNLSCNEIIYAPDQGCEPNSDCYDSSGIFHEDWCYRCPGMGYYCIRCDRSIPAGENPPPKPPENPEDDDDDDDDEKPDGPENNKPGGPDDGGCPDLPKPIVVVPGLGNCTFEPPEPSSLINTSEWGEVPADQVLVVAREDCDYCMVCEIADGLKGEVVGYIDFINLFQIKTKSKTEAELRDNISRALEIPCIELAFPHQKVFPESSPLDDPVYLEGRDRSYRIVGVPEAWEAIRSSGLDLSETKVGVVDDGLYKGYGEFDGVVHINTRSNGSLLDKPSPDFPSIGSHGTGIMNLIAADPDNGGLVGIASEPLRENLTVLMINMGSPLYSKTGDFWYMGYHAAILHAEAMGSNIISFSYGNSQADPGAVNASANFFRELQETNPDHLFVCSAGNDGKAMDGSRRFPYTYHMPNIITVGCINNDGTLRKHSNRNSGNFEVTIAAPGDQAVWGRDKQGNIVNEGGETSMSVPFVTATAAQIRSLNPDLNASEIKALLVKTARESIELDGREVAAPEEVGGRVLAADLAVQEVIEELKED